MGMADYCRRIWHLILTAHQQIHTNLSASFPLIYYGP